MHKVMYIATVDLEETDWTHFPATTEELLVTTKAAPATTKAAICCIVFYIKCRCINVRRRSVDCLLHCSNTFFWVQMCLHGDSACCASHQCRLLLQLLWVPWTMWNMWNIYPHICLSTWLYVRFWITVYPCSKITRLQCDMIEWDWT